MTTLLTTARTVGTLHSRRADRPDAPALLSLAVEAFAEGRTRAGAPAAGGLTDMQLNEDLAAYVYGHLARPDQQALTRLREVRERALALGRAGEQVQADGTMKAARFLLSASAFSPLGRAAADTLQQAAESYLSYRRGDFADAGARMTLAIEATNRLGDAWGESRFTTGRRIHLLHNLMRVEARRGAWREAMTLGGGILAHIAGSATGPHLPALDRPGPALEPLVATGFFNVVAATAAEVLAAVPDAEAKELLAPLAGMVHAPGLTDSYGWGWIVLKSAALADDPRPFLVGAAPFLRAGRGRAPVLWYAVALDVLRAARGLGSASDGVADIQAALSTDPRVPACMRLVADAGAGR